MTEDINLFRICEMLQNLDDKMTRLEKLLSPCSPSLGSYPLYTSFNPYKLDYLLML